MSSLNETAQYSFTVPPKYDEAGTEIAPATNYKLRRLSLREREDSFGGLFESLQITAGQYINEGSYYRLEILHRDLVKLLQSIAHRNFVQEVSTWLGRRGAGVLIVALAAHIMTEEGLISPEAEPDDENTLPSDGELEAMDKESLETLGEDLPGKSQTTSMSPCGSRAETSSSGVSATGNIQPAT
ncbi:MAG: hypothetical protein WC381_10825 [Kiritimatiellia bacterium]|jgi:hypothetical protein